MSGAIDGADADVVNSVIDMNVKSRELVADNVGGSPNPAQKTSETTMPAAKPASSTEPTRMCSESVLPRRLCHKRLKPSANTQNARSRTCHPAV